MSVESKEEIARVQEEIDRRRPPTVAEDPSGLVDQSAVAGFCGELLDAQLDTRQRAYLAALSMTGGRTVKSCQIARIAYATLKAWRRDSQAFVEYEERANRIWLETLEQEADRRAVAGVEKPVFGSLGRGEGSGQIGTIREYSDRLLEFRLRALDPEKYADRKKTELSGPGGGAIPIEAVRSELAEKFARQREARIAQRATPTSEENAGLPDIPVGSGNDVPHGTLDSASITGLSPGETGTL